MDSSARPTAYLTVLTLSALDKENDELYIAIYKNTTSPNTKLVPPMGKMVNARGPV